jgi:voltage-gated potassium channel
MNVSAITVGRSREKHFPLFLLSTILPLVALPIANVHGSGTARFALPLTITLLILQSIRTVPPWSWRPWGLSMNRTFQGLGLVGAITVWLPFAEGHQLPTPIRFLMVTSRALFFLLTAIRVIQTLAFSRRVSPETLSLGAAGYIHMGLTGGLLATALQLVDSDSFRLGALQGGEELLSRLTYFSFVTIGTLGYGDVIPTSPIGESFVVLLSITSTLYISLLIGLLLSRYIASKAKAVAGLAMSELEDER